MREWTVPPGELSVAFLNDADLARLHGQFLDDPSPTDVITFPGDPDMDFAGEICVSWERASAEAAARGTGLNHELTLYLVHGWLHLAGLDDRTEDDRAVMRAAEAEVLSRLVADCLLPDFRIAASNAGQRNK